MPVPVQAIELTSPSLPRLQSSDEILATDEIPLRLEISLSKRTLSVFQGEVLLNRYPVAVGRAGWETPVGQFKVLQKIHKPDWKNPFNGDIIPGGDPENPLGQYWIGFWSNGKNSIGLHGTPNPKSVGRAASHGCVRMYNKDIEELFPKVKSGTLVIVTR
ncbi:MAG: L,D-transpeptidase [Scytolyngbya sp. HA4215-MV1]|jgi:lipoprotein-anchoring transpeptidase ErfK/SrfK|nr:L,D-transpeptidase [Scytolyngbya sp. HA4215-MV1]